MVFRSRGVSEPSVHGAAFQRIGAKLRAWLALGLLAATSLSACVGPDLEPPFSGSKEASAPADKPTTDGAAGSAAAPAGTAAGGSFSAPAIGASAGARASSDSAAAGRGGSKAADAGVADDDAGVAP